MGRNTKIKHLSSRLNLTVFEVFDVPVVVYEDHRTLLQVLFYIRKNRIFPTPINVVYLDRHSDCNDPKASLDSCSKMRDEECDLESSWSFVEWDCSVQDHDWLKTGMDCKLIADALSIGRESVSNLLETGTITNLTDRFGGNHNYAISPNIWHALSLGGVFFRSKDNKWKEWMSSLGWDTSTGSLSGPPTQPFILDIDLDLIAHEFDGPPARPDRPNDHKGHIAAWPEHVIRGFLHRKPHGSQITACDWLRQMVARASCVTIARESAWCGGFTESQKILDILDADIFDGGLSRDFPAFAS
jgi:hypothetical protein